MWKNDSILLRTYTEPFRGEKLLDLKTIDNGVPYENVNIGVYGCAISTKEDRRSFESEIKEIDNNIYNLKCYGQIIKLVNTTIVRQPVYLSGDFKNINIMCSVSCTWEERKDYYLPGTVNFTITLPNVGYVSGRFRVYINDKDEITVTSSSSNLLNWNRWMAVYNVTSGIPRRWRVKFSATFLLKIDSTNLINIGSATVNADAEHGWETLISATGWRTELSYENYGDIVETDSDAIVIISESNK